MFLTIGLVVPLMLVGLYNQWETWDNSRELLNRSMEQQARLAATAFEQWVGAQRQTLLTISDLAQSGAANNDVLSEYLNSIVKTRPAWLNVEIIDPNGNVTLAQNAKKWNLQATPIEVLKGEIDQNRPLVIATEQIADKQLRLISLAMPLPDGNFVVARIDGVSASDVFRRLELPEKHIIAVFDSNGRLIYRSQVSPEQLSIDASRTPLLTALNGNRTGVIEVESPYDKITRIYGLARLEPVNAVVAVGVPRDDLYGTAQQQLRQQLLLSILIACLAVFAAFLIARSVTEPMRRLSLAAREFGEGNLSARSGVENDPAISELGTTFNQMAEKIAAREEKLKELDQLKSDFVSSVSHELRTPLTTIKTLTRVLERGNLSKEDQAEYLEAIGAECDRQIELVQNLLDLSRLESGTYRPLLEETDTSEVLRSVVAVQQKAAEARGQLIELFLPDEPLPPTMADPIALRRVVSGVLENSLKYTPERGSVKVIGGRVDENVVIKISDNGCGIAQEDLGRVFEKFYRGRPFAASPFSAPSGNGVTPEACLALEPPPGMGLGLYLVKNLLDQMGGRIEVKSPAVNSHGTVFAISLPIYDDPA